MSRLLQHFVTVAACGAVALATNTSYPTSAFAQDYSSNYQTSGCPGDNDSQFVHAKTKSFGFYRFFYGELTLKCQDNRLRNLKLLKLRKPYPNLLISFSLLFIPSTTPLVVPLSK